MSGFLIAVVVGLSIVAWLAMWATSVRFAEQCGDQESREDRQIVAFCFGAFLAPLTFVFFALWRFLPVARIGGWLDRYTSPNYHREERNEVERDRLKSEARRYRDLSAHADGTERDVLRAAADACEREANTLR